MSPLYWNPPHEGGGGRENNHLAAQPGLENPAFFVEWGAPSPRVHEDGEVLKSARPPAPRVFSVRTVTIDGFPPLSLMPIRVTLAEKKKKKKHSRGASWRGVVGLQTSSWRSSASPEGNPFQHTARNYIHPMIYKYTSSPRVSDRWANWPLGRSLTICEHTNCIGPVPMGIRLSN